MQLWNLRPEYKQFELKVFMQHISQEIRRNKFINWCNKKWQEKEVDFNAIFLTLRAKRRLEPR
jgi:hypothetical protein